MITFNLEFELTAEMIAAGIKGKCKECPFYFALIPHIKPGYDISIHSTILVIESQFHGRQCVVRFPRSVARDIKKFDDGFPIYPRKYKMTIDNDYLTNGSLQ